MPFLTNTVDMLTPLLILKSHHIIVENYDAYVPEKCYWIHTNETVLNQLIVIMGYKFPNLVYVHFYKDCYLVIL